MTNLDPKQLAEQIIRNAITRLVVDDDTLGYDSDLLPRGMHEQLEELIDTAVVTVMWPDQNPAHITCTDGCTGYNIKPASGTDETTKTLIVSAKWGDTWRDERMEASSFSICDEHLFAYTAGTLVAAYVADAWKSARFEQTTATSR